MDDTLWGRPVARRGDPGTSWAAAASVENLTRTRRAVLAVLEAHPEGMTDPEIWEALPWDERTSPSGIRTRRAELVDAGLVKDSGRTKRGRTNRRMILWEVA